MRAENSFCFVSRSAGLLTKFLAPVGVFGGAFEKINMKY